MPFSVFNAAGAALNQSLTDTPVGSIQPFAGASAPSGWLLCDGAAVSRTTYAELFAVLGTTYGTGNGSTTFNVPDLRGRVPAGLDNMGGNAASRLTNTVLSASNTLGATGGAQTHTMSVTEMPAHNHDASVDYMDPTQAHNHSSRSGYIMHGSTNRSGTFTDTTAIQSKGGGGAHTNTQPTLVVNYIILASSLATRLQAAALPQYVTSLPSSPVDGQTVVYAADATNGVMWTLRYRAAGGTYKWEAVGASALSNEVSGAVSTSSTSFADLTGSTGPSITVPLAGDYLVYIESNGYAGSANNIVGSMRVTQSAATSTLMSSETTYTSYQGGTQHTSQKLITLAANTTYKMQYAVNGNSVVYRNRAMTIRPVRVG